MDEQTLQERYADLVLKKGVNIQKNQALVINAPIEGVEFVRLVAKKAYDLGAKNVHINWADDELTFLKYRHAGRFCGRWCCIFIYSCNRPGFIKRYRSTKDCCSK